MFKFKQKRIGKTENNGTKNADIMVPLKYLINFWKTHELSIINCKTNLILTNTNANQNTKHYVPVTTLSTKDNVKLLQQLQ